jgi:hypothetical protein
MKQKKGWLIHPKQERDTLITSVNPKHRRDRQKKKAMLKANLESIERLQTDIAARSEKINTLEQFATDFKASQKELNSFHAVLEDFEQILADKSERLPGTLVTIAAFASYCGPLGMTKYILSRNMLCPINSILVSAERKRMIYAWREVLQREGVTFDLDFLKLPIVIEDEACQQQGGGSTSCSCSWDMFITDSTLTLTLKIVIFSSKSTKLQMLVKT